MLKETTKNLFIGIARTATPMIAGFILSLFTNIGLDLDPELQAELSVLVFGLLTLAYYAAAAALERYVSPKFGWLLGVAKTPDYQKTLTDNEPTIRKALTPEQGDEGLAG